MIITTTGNAFVVRYMWILHLVVIPFLPTAGEGNLFTSVCLFTGGEGGYLWAHVLCGNGRISEDRVSRGVGYLRIGYPEV